MTGEQLTPEDLEAFRSRWRLVHAAEVQELRTTPIAEKLRQLEALMSSAALFSGWEALSSEDDEVRERWARLKRAGGAGI